MAAAVLGDLEWSIDRLDEANWSVWKFQMKHLLLAKGLWGLVDNTEVLRQGASAQQESEHLKRQQKTFSTIILAICLSQLYLITSHEKPKPAWDALCNHFERNTLANKLLLKKQYFRMEMSDGTTIEAHLKQMKELTRIRITHCRRGPSCDSSGELANQISNSCDSPRIPEMQFR